MVVSDESDEVRVGQNALGKRNNFELDVIGVPSAGGASRFVLAFVALEFAETRCFVSCVTRRARSVDAFVVSSSVEADAVWPAVDFLF